MGINNKHDNFYGEMPEESIKVIDEMTSEEIIKNLRSMRNEVDDEYTVLAAANYIARIQKIINRRKLK